MNANELADFVEISKPNDKTHQTIATMLRQQADLIRNLEKSLGFKNSGYETIALTPPVAWINLDRFKDEALYLADCVSENEVDNMGITTPLYTHPAKEQLTDEEMEKVRVAIMNTAYWCADENMSEAYNAVKVCCSEVLEILRKAQEK